jgi:hypothetical protein
MSYGGSESVQDARLFGGSSSEYLRRLLGTKQIDTLYGADVRKFNGELGQILGETLPDLREERPRSMIFRQSQLYADTGQARLSTRSQC